MTTCTLDARALNCGDVFFDGPNRCLILRARQCRESFALHIPSGQAAPLTEVLFRNVRHDAGHLNYRTFTHGERVTVPFSA